MWLYVLLSLALLYVIMYYIIANAGKTSNTPEDHEHHIVSESTKSEDGNNHTPDPDNPIPFKNRPNTDIPWQGPQCHCNKDESYLPHLDDDPEHGDPRDY